MHTFRTVHDTLGNNNVFSLYIKAQLVYKTSSHCGPENLIQTCTKYMASFRFGE